MARRTSQMAVSACASMVALFLISACLTNINMSPLGYGCSVSADCHGTGVCSDAGLCVLDAGAPNTALLYRLDHGSDPAQLLLDDPARREAAEDAGWPAGEAVCYVHTRASGDVVPVYEFQRTDGDWLFTSDFNELPAIRKLDYDGGEVAFYGYFSTFEDAGVRIRRYEHQGFHHYAINSEEGSTLVSEGWIEESFLFGCDPP